MAALFRIARRIISGTASGGGGAGNHLLAPNGDFFTAPNGDRFTF